MRSIKVFITLLIVQCTLLIGTASAQWWVQGGNLLWPYGDVSVSKNLNVDGTINGVKKYVASISQSDTSAPIATVLENSLGNIVWTRTSAGNYSGTLNGAFPAGKTFIYPTMTRGVDGYAVEGELIEVFRSDNNTIWLPSYLNGANADNIIVGFTLEIRVYP